MILDAAAFLILYSQGIRLNEIADFYGYELPEEFNSRSQTLTLDLRAWFDPRNLTSNSSKSSDG